MKSDVSPFWRYVLAAMALFIALAYIGVSSASGAEPKGLGSTPVADILLQPCDTPCQVVPIRVFLRKNQHLARFVGDHRVCQFVTGLGWSRPDRQSLFRSVNQIVASAQQYPVDANARRVCTGLSGWPSDAIEMPEGWGLQCQFFHPKSRPYDVTSGNRIGRLER